IQQINYLIYAVSLFVDGMMGAGWMQGARFSRRSPIYLKRTTTHLRFLQAMPQGEGLALYTTIPVM
ncbi:TPA: hypothetical protein ACQ7VM_004702, partial [Escherichia coli]